MVKNIFKLLLNKIRNNNGNCKNNLFNIDENVFLSINAITKEILFKDIKFSSYLDTFKELIESNKSFIRFGDGELLFLLSNSGTCFEEFNIDKAKRLLETWKKCNIDEKIIIGVDDFIINPKFTNLDRGDYYNNINFASKLPNIKILSILSKNRKYFSQQIFALPPIMWSDFNIKNNNQTIKFYAVEDKFFIGEKKYSCKDFYSNSIEGKKILLEYNKNYFKPLQNVFKDKIVILLTSESSKFGMRNNIFSYATKTINIWCNDNINLNDNFHIIEKLKNEIKNEKLSELICVVSYGVEGKNIALDVHNLGIRVIDMGSFSVVYDYYNNLNQINFYDERNKLEKFNLR